MSTLLNGVNDLYAPEENTVPEYLDDESVDLTHLSRFRVSSQKGDLGLEYLLDNNRSTFWQSDGSLPHYVEIQFSKVVNVSSIAIFTDRRVDESYTPLYLEVYAGFGRFDTVKVDSYELHGKEGWEFLTWDTSGSKDGLLCSYMSVNIRRNYQNGKDTRVKGLRVLGPRSHEGIESIKRIEQLDEVVFRRPQFQRI